MNAFRDVCQALEDEFGAAIDNDDQINGGDAVEFIVDLIIYHVRPALRRAKQ